MSTITRHSPRPVFGPKLATPGLRLRVWLTRRTLDQRLADGESILAAPALAHRADGLGSRRSRHSLAKGLRRVLADAERPSRSLSAAVPLQRHEVLRSRACIERIAEALEGVEPVSVSGIAQVQILLTDGNSPFYLARPDDELHHAVERAELALIGTD